MVEYGVEQKNATVFVVGNKNDIKTREVEQSEINAFVKKRNYEYMSTSASNGDNVNEVVGVVGDL